jgi:hypothetical protein
MRNGTEDIEFGGITFVFQDCVRIFTPCDFFLWGYVKDRAFVPPLGWPACAHHRNWPQHATESLARTWLPALCVLCYAWSAHWTFVMRLKKLCEFSLSSVLIVFTCVVSNLCKHSLKSGTSFWLILYLAGGVAPLEQWLGYELGKQPAKGKHQERSASRFFSLHFTLKMEIVCSSETSVNLYQTTLQHITDDRTFQNSHFCGTWMFITVFTNPHHRRFWTWKSKYYHSDSLFMRSTCADFSLRIAGLI